jgi:hypothetical protein
MAEPITFGLTPVQAARSAAIVALMGLAGLGAVARVAAREGTPLHTFLSALGLSAMSLFVVGAVLLLGVAVVGARKALATATQFSITEDGLRILGPAGLYRLAWDNIEQMGTLFERDLGIAVRNRGAVLASHEGTVEQRERFERQLGDEPYQGWDFHYFRHELGMPVDRVLFLLEQARDPKVLVTQLDDGQIVDG